MASISQLSDGKKLIQFIDAAQKRRTIRLGKVSLRQAEAVRSHIEHLVACALLKQSIESRTAIWLTEIPEEFYRRIASTGLISNRDESASKAEIKAYINKYIESRNVKESTRTVWRRTRKHLVEFFGESKDLATITSGDAKDFRNYLIRRGLSENTVKRTCGIAKQFFEDAIDRDLIIKNPFKHREIPTATGGNRDRMHFVSAVDTEKLLQACGSHQWKRIIALCRYGGLRCPSEVHALKWDDIDWAAKRIHITSPKTEHHDGKDSREIPLFPELQQILTEAFEMADDGAVHVVENRTENPRTTMERIVKRAKLKQWPKLFQNLRSSRQTELEELFPTHVVCAWLGNSESVAKRHYLQVHDEHFERAAKCAAQTASNHVKAHETT